MLLGFPHGPGLPADLQKLAGRKGRACSRMNTGRKKKGMPLQGLIFDLDGVLTDTAEYHYQAWQRLADDLGILFDRTRNEALLGVSRCQSLELLLIGRAYAETPRLALRQPR